MLRHFTLRAARPTVRTAIARPAVARMPMRFYSEDKAAAAGAADAAAGDAAKPAETEGAAESSGNPEIDELRQKYEAKDQECAKFKDAYMRSKADFQNLQKTTEREIKKAKDYAIQKFAKDLVESVDNFDLALQAVPKDKLEGEGHKELQDFYSGVKMVQDVFEKTLARHGLTKTSPEGEKFDANEHEAVFQAPQPDKEPGTVFFVQRTGFKLNDRVIRAPKVGVVAETQ